MTISRACNGSRLQRRFAKRQKADLDSSLALIELIRSRCKDTRSTCNLLFIGKLSRNDVYSWNQRRNGTRQNARCDPVVPDDGVFLAGGERSRLLSERGSDGRTDQDQ